MAQTADILNGFKKIPGGLWLFSKILCLKAPYFSTIRPKFLMLESGRGEAFMKKRWSVQNHLGTIHAIAVANLCELVAGTTLEVTIPDTHRWIPKSMNIEYLKKAQSHLTAKTSILVNQWPDSNTIPIVVEVFDQQNQLVVKATIQMYISRKTKNS